MKRNIDTTLLIVIKNNKILLAKKKRGFGAGLFNGVGGKKQEGETIYEAMIRETQEEINIVPLNTTLVGIMDFDLYLKGENVTEKMYTYIATDYEGEPTESDEMKPEWFDLDNIPYDNMFQDDIIWLPEVLKGNKIRASFSFDKEMNLISQVCHTVETIEQ